MRLPLKKLAPAVAVVIACAAFTPASASAAGVVATLNDLEASGQIDATTAGWAKQSYADARSVNRRAKGASKTAIRYVIRVAEGLARSNRLTADRVRPVFVILQRNAYWFKSNGPVREGTDRRFGDSRLIFQYFAGRGWQIHPLSNFAKLNAVWTDKSKPARRALAAYAAELLTYAVNRGGFLTWEYYFDFGGGRPPWISSISQGTAVQALARSGNALKDDTLTAAARQAVGAFEADAPNGLRVRAEDGPHYLIYSFAKRLRVLNAFLQSLDGLRDYSRITDDARAYDLYLAGLETARNETRKSDTGAWSLYSVGGAESNMHYHLLLRDFLTKICDANREDVFCGTRDRFTGYTREQPRIEGVRARKRGRRVHVYFTLSKISNVTVSALKGTGVKRSAKATVGRGDRRFSFAAPNRGLYTIRVVARDLAGNSSSQKIAFRVRR